LRHWWLAAALVLTPFAAAAQSVDLARSEIAFGFRQENVPGTGKFRKFTADVGFDAAKPEALRAAIEVDVTSVDLGGDPGWNADIQAPSWFNTRQFPKASFVASGAKALGGGRFEAPAKFTLKGVTRDVVATFTAKSEAGGTLLEGTVPLKRMDFKVGDGAWADTSVVANDVAVRFKVFLKR
jgi:polyisoprenoid-binding protein YceI